MKIKTKIYAKALAKAILGGKAPVDKIIDNFVKILIKAGMEKKAKEILDLAEDMLLKENGNRKITFEVARRLTFENRDLLKQFVKSGDVVKEKINRELIAGVKIMVNDEKQFDNSLRNKLQNMF